MHQICTNFWIPKSRKQEKRIIKKCLVCRQHERKGFSYSSLPDLSSIRLIKDFPFTYIGADYDGPLMLKIFLKLGYFYTLASTRNLYLDLVHDCCSRTCIRLDLVHDCCSRTCIRALTRFFCNRGVPKFKFISSKTNFHSYKRVLHGNSILQHHLGGVAYLNSFFVPSKDVWIFNCEQWPAGIYLLKVNNKDTLF